MARTTIVIPCYNEAFRFDAEAFASALSRDPDLDLIFVNDGSSDGTLALLRDFETAHRDRASAIDQQPNRGKAEAVRTGMLAGFQGDADFVGYWDADLATPLDEIPRFIETFEAHPELQIVIGSRVKLLGRSIERRAPRHYLGRIAATLTSITLRLGVYDTQCGAKLFRNDSAMLNLFEDPLESGWVFDVELIARLIRDRRVQGLSGAETVLYELPLNRWHDVAGSKVKPSSFLRALVEMFRIRIRYLRN
jgi:dolichyl-phosphate beta-glucosyltransferase